MSVIAWVLLAIVALFGVGSLIAMWLVRKQMEASK